jgi:hypothetical protein
MLIDFPLLLCMLHVTANALKHAVLGQYFTVSCINDDLELKSLIESQLFKPAVELLCLRLSLCKVTKLLLLTCIFIK